MWTPQPVPGKMGTGCSVVYYRTTAEYVRNYSLSYQNCVQGYNPAVDGIIVVTRGDRIVASNDISLLDTTVDRKTPPFPALKARSTDGGMIHVHSTTGSSTPTALWGRDAAFISMSTARSRRCMSLPCAM